MDFRNAVTIFGEKVLKFANTKRNTNFHHLSEEKYGN